MTTDHQSKDKASCVAGCSGEEGRRSETSLLWSKELLNWLILLSNLTLNILIVIQNVIPSVLHKMVHDLKERSQASQAKSHHLSQ